MSNLYISLAALAANYRILKEKTAAEVAAVVKANAYGLGVEPIVGTLAEAGCERFFVATLEEGAEARACLPGKEIFVLNGLGRAEEAEFIRLGLIPVINTPEQASRWEGECVVQVDTGMTRLGISAADLEKIDFSRLRVKFVMSHLACADTPEHPQNKTQLNNFKKALGFFPGVPASLAASAGVFLGADYHFNLARCGIALYGGNPLPGGSNPMRSAVRLTAPIIQIRRVDSKTAVGYGATREVEGGTVIATIAAGYADGMLRGLGNRGKCFVAGREASFLGRVSMDLITADVTGVPEGLLAEGVEAELIGESYTISDMARDAGTIDYEIITRLGSRFKRHYV